MIQEREELKRKIRLIDYQIYQLAGGKEEKINISQSNFNPMIPHSVQPSFMHGQSFHSQYYYEQFGQMKPQYFKSNPPQGMMGMGMQTQFQINPMPSMPSCIQPQYYHSQFNPMISHGNPLYQDQFNPMTKNKIQPVLSVWKESTKFSTNILINYSKNKASSIHLENNFYLKIKIFTIKVNENKLVSAFIYNYNFPKKISIKICDLKNHIGNIMIIESELDLSFIDSIIDIDRNYILFGIWLIDINLCQIIFTFNTSESQFFKKYFKLLNGNILIYSSDNNYSGEYKFVNYQLVKIKQNFIEESDIIIENKNNDKEIITYSNNMLKIWEKSN